MPLVSWITDLLKHQESDSFFLFWTREAALALLIFVFFYIISRIVGKFLLVWGPKFTAFTKSDLDDRILNRITPPVSFLITSLGLYYAIKSLPLNEKLHAATAGAIFVLVIITLTNIAWRTLDELIIWYGAKIRGKDNSGGLDLQLLPLIEKLVTIFLISTSLIITLKHFNYDILSLVTALGIGSLAIGMAAKDTLAHVISGFTIMLDRPFRLGDRIQLSSGKMGDVVSIGLRSTKIKTLDNMLLIIPNSDLCNTSVVNFAFPDFRAKGKISLGVSYSSDTAHVKNVLLSAAKETEGVLPDPPSDVFFTDFGESSLNFTLFFWVDDFSKLFAVTDRLNSLILEKFRSEKIEIPYPVRTIINAKDGE